MTQAPLIRVLLVDDEKLFFVLVKTLLSQIKQRTFSLDWVSTYEQALLEIHKRSHDLYLLDYYLGKKSGLDLLNQLEDKIQYAPFIMLTGTSDEEIDFAATEAGAADYIDKRQISAKTLERSTRYALERHRMLSQERARHLKLEALERLFATMTLDPIPLLMDACTLVGKVFDFKRVSAAIVHDAQDDFDLHFYYDPEGRNAGLQSSWTISKENQPVFSHVVQERKLFSITAGQLMGMNLPFQVQAGTIGYALPIGTQEKTLAILGMFRDAEKPLPPDDQMLLDLLGNQLGRALENAQLHQEINRLLNSYVPRAVVETLLENPAKAALGGERQMVTVMFSDLRDFSTFAEQTEPEALIQFMNICLNQAAEAIIAYGGTPTQFVGDQVMALFNAPKTQPNHILQAVKAALKITQAMDTFNLTHNNAMKLNFGIGIHTGEAVVGNVGAADMQYYTAAGDTVHIAYRLQQTAQPGEILVTEQMVEHIQNAVHLEPVGLLTVKGRRSKVETYRVVRLIP